MSDAGMNSSTGRSLGGMDHIRQSIRDILTTPIGSRIMRRDYGSLVPDLIDHPANAANQLRIMSATVMAVIRWEPRISVTRAAFSLNASGRGEVDMEGVRRDGPRSGSPISFSIPV